MSAARAIAGGVLGVVTLMGASDAATPQAAPEDQALASHAVARTPAREPADMAIDVRIAQAPPARRIVALEWNPLAFFAIGKVSGNLVIVPISHHALVLSPFYASTETLPVDVYDNQGNPTELPRQRFFGFGGEIGYRYYTGGGGPRGLFAGPSLLLGSMTARAQNGDTTSYATYGVALDIGYESLLADAVALSLGAGVQYTTTDKAIPNQQFPADIYANSRLWPRALASVGWAF